MADRTIKPDDTHDLVLQNNDGSSKIELNEDQTVKVSTGSSTGDDFTVNTTQLVVEGDTGNVGIGDATPSNKLVVDAGTTAATAMQIVTYGGYTALHLVDDGTNTGSTSLLIEGGDGHDANIKFKTGADDWIIKVDGSEPNDPLLFYDYASASTVMTMVNGLVGLGTTSPSSYDGEADNLVVYGTGHVGITIRSGTTGKGKIHFADGTSSYDPFRGMIYYDHSDNSMSLATNALTRMTILEGGNVGINTTNPGYLLDVDGNIGYEGTIADYSLRRLKEDIEGLDGSGFIEKFKNIPLYRYRYKPKVSKEELKDLAFREFGSLTDAAIEAVDEVLWTEDDDLPEGVEVGDIKVEAVKAQEEKWEWDKWDEIFPNGHDAGRMWDCPDEELKAFLDEKAEEIRASQRDEKYDKNSLNFGLIADDAILAEKFPELVDYRRHPDTNELESWGIRSTSYIGMLHGVLKELVERVETLENA